MHKWLEQLLGLSFHQKESNIKGPEQSGLLNLFLGPLESQNGCGPSKRIFELCCISKAFKRNIFAYYRHALLPNLKKKDVAYDRVDLKHQEVALFAKFGASEEKCAFIEAMSAEKTDFQKYKG